MRCFRARRPEGPDRGRKVNDLLFFYVDKHSFLDYDLNIISAYFSRGAFVKVTGRCRAGRF